jgi:hypothetical protein
MSSQPNPLARQEHRRTELSRQYEIDPGDIYFLNSRDPLEPWLAPDALVTIARKRGGFQVIEDEFLTFEPNLDQIIHRATVVDEAGRTFRLPGVATRGEKPNGREIDPHKLAGGRALGATLTAAGFNPLRTGAAQPSGCDQSRIIYDDPTLARNNDIKQIHLLAEQAGLIVPLEGGGKDDREYRAYLLEHFDVNSSVFLDAVHRASLIQALKQMCK